MATTAFTYPRRTYTEAPPFTAPEGGLLDAAFIKTVASGDPLLRGYVFESHAGEVTLDEIAYQGLSATDNPGAGDGLTFVTSADPFTASAEIDLTFLDFQQEDADTRVEQRFAHAEALKVEAKVWTTYMLGATVLTSGTAYKPSKALGLLAEWIGTRFAGVPYFHAGRRVSNEIAASQLTVLPDDGRAVAAIKGGGILINGAGYTAKTGPTGATDASANQAWLYVTGTPMLVRGPVVLAPESPDYAHNHDHGLATRIYVPAFDGAMAAVLVDLS